MAEVLAQQIKDIQRTDPSGKQAWWNYADEQGNSIRDPAKHEMSFLQSFIDQYNSGAFKGIASTETKKGYNQDAGNLGDFFKDCQRNSPSFKMAWASFVDMRGMRKNDPTQAGKENLVTFLEFVSQQGMMAMAMMSGGNNGGGNNMGGNMGNNMGGNMGNQMGGNMGGNMGNQMGGNMGGNMGNQMGGNMGNNMGGNMNQMGNQMGGGMGGGMNQMGNQGDQGDQMGNQNDYQSVNNQMANQMGGGGGGTGGMIEQRMQMMQQMQNGGGMGQPAMKKQRTGDPMKDALVEKVKMFQRAGNEQKQAWWTFCDAQEGQNRDPSRYEADVLQMFCAAYQM